MFSARPFFFSRVCAYVYAPTDLILHVERCASYSIIVRYEENAKKKDSKYENKCSRELPRLLFGFFDLSCTRNDCALLLFFLFLMPNSARVLFFFLSFLWQPCLFSTRASLSFLFFLACFGHACYVVNEAPSFRTEIGS